MRKADIKINGVNQQNTPAVGSTQQPTNTQTRSPVQNINLGPSLSFNDFLGALIGNGFTEVIVPQNRNQDNEPENEEGEEEEDDDEDVD